MTTTIDTTNAQTWAETWLALFTELLDDPSGTVYAEPGGDFDLSADMWAGDMPWHEPLASEVMAIVEADPRFPRIRDFSNRIDSEFGERVQREIAEGKRDANGVLRR